MRLIFVLKLMPKTDSTSKISILSDKRLRCTDNVFKRLQVDVGQPAQLQYSARGFSEFRLFWEPGSAVARAESLKPLKYTYLAAKYSVSPLAFEELGGSDPATRTLLVTESNSSSSSVFHQFQTAEGDEVGGVQTT